MSETDYDELRRKNIAERNAVFAEFFKELETEKKSSVKIKNGAVRESTGYYGGEDEENQPPKKKRRLSASKVNAEYRVNKFQLEFKRKYNTRSRARRISEEGSVETDDEPKERLVRKGRSIKVMFPWAKPFEREIEMMRMDKWDVDKDLAEENEYDTSDDDDKDGSEYGTKRRSVVNRVTKSVYDPDSIPSVDEITPAMLKNVATRSSGKTYCKLKGTSCHQCRQKTMDTKTVCRSGECVGVRGQFCGPCLRGRYGEDAVTVLKDPNWACPPCRGLCNCSICRTRNGQRPTGILAPVAQEEGFDSVMDYLRATSGDEEEAEDAEEDAGKEAAEKVAEEAEEEAAEEAEEEAAEETEEEEAEEAVEEAAED